MTYRNRSLARRLAAPAALLFAAASLASAGDWPQWRGANRDGVAAGESLPDPLPETLVRAWRTEVGAGFSAPVVVAGRVFLMARENDLEYYAALEAASGKILWKTPGYAAPFAVPSYAVVAGDGPKATLAHDEGRLYGLGITEVLSCVEAESGKVLWRHDFSKKYDPIWPEVGASGSVLISGDLCITQVGTKGEGGVAAFDKRTGELRWHSDEGGPSYAAPEPFEFGGVPQIATFVQEAIVGLDLASGRRLWRIPFKTDYNQNIVSPVRVGDILIYTGLQAGTHGIRLRPESAPDDARFEPESVWSNNDHFSYMTAPVVRGDRVWFLSGKRKGALVCLDGRNGATLWVGPGRYGEYASIVLAGDKLLVLNDTGEIRVVEASADEYVERANWVVSESPTWAHLTFADGALFVKDETAVARFEFD